MKAITGIQQSLGLQVEPPPFSPLEPQGVVFTKPWVVELILDLAGYEPTEALFEKIAVEPAAGEGAFLGAMVRRLAESCRQFGWPIEDCAKCIVAYELNEISSKRARQVVFQVLLESGVGPSTADGLARSWVRTGDYLFDSMTIEADFVIGNPPYVRLEEIPEQTVTLYRRLYRTMCGRADLYVGFFEAALRQLKPGGVCAFICADRWMRNQYGAELRKLITSSFSVETVIEMHGADAFHDEVDAYPAVTVIRRHAQGPTVVATLGLEAGKLPLGDLKRTLLHGLKDGEERARVGISSAHVATWFQGPDPWPCHSPRQLALLRKLEDDFLPLMATCKVGIGVATGSDRIFITRDPDLVESSRLLKLALADDISGGTMAWSGHYLVDPWDSGGLVSLEEYPRLAAYFGKHEAALKLRHTAIRKTRGWYKTIDRVSHSLVAERKLYIADIKDLLNPVLDDGETYPHHNLYFIQSGQWDLEVLGGLLTSDLCHFFVESYGVRMRGGYLRFQAQYLRRIRLPDPKGISEAEAAGLRKAFRERDRVAATKLSLPIYGVEQRELELALGR